MICLSIFCFIDDTAMERVENVLFHLCYTVVDCGELSLTNGKVSYRHSTAYSSVATYSCNAGYDLIGTNTRTCLESGDWSGSPPTCSGKNECAHHTVLERVS